MKDKIYLDHAATSPMRLEVIEVITEAFRSNFGNASSMHQFGRAARKSLDDARTTFAKSIGATFNEIVLTSGGTESDNMALVGVAKSRKHIGKHIISTIVEHPAVLKTLESLEQDGFEITLLPVDQTGQISLVDLKEQLREDTILVTIMSVNNEVGTVFPISEIGAIVKESNAYFHTDAVQAYGLEEIDVQSSHIDLLSVSSHKINGPKGTGFIYIRNGIHLPSFMTGGEQEMKRRGGTEAIPQMVGFAKAVELMESEKNARKTHYQSLKKQLLAGLEANEIDFAINGDFEKDSPHILNIRFKGIQVEQMLMNLDILGIAVSNGSACTAGNVNPSHVLVAMHQDDGQIARESIRFSFGYGNTADEIDFCIAQITAIVNRLKN